MEEIKTITCIFLTTASQVAQVSQLSPPPSKYHNSACIMLDHFRQNAQDSQQAIEVSHLTQPNSIFYPHQLFVVNFSAVDCKFYKYGDDFKGNISTDANGQQCTGWRQLAESSMFDTVPFIQKLKKLSSRANFCRYDDVYNGVYCPVKGGLSPCNIPYCSM